MFSQILPFIRCKYLRKLIKKMLKKQQCDFLLFKRGLLDLLPASRNMAGASLDIWQRII